MSFKFAIKKFLIQLNLHVQPSFLSNHFSNNLMGTVLEGGKGGGSWMQQGVGGG